MQEAVTAAAKIVCCAVQENDQLTSAALLLAVYFVHLRTEADSQAVI